MDRPQKGHKVFKRNANGSPVTWTGKQGSNVCYQLGPGKREGSTGSWYDLVHRCVTNRDDTADGRPILQWQCGTPTPNQRSSKTCWNTIKLEHRVTLMQGRTEHFLGSLIKTPLFHCSTPASPTTQHRDTELMRQCHRWSPRQARARNSPKVPTHWSTFAICATSLRGSKSTKMSKRLTSANRCFADSCETKESTHGTTKRYHAC